MIECRQGDCLEVLPMLPAQSVQCCVTSPPYWGLRDYGTATWEGGESGCDHKYRVPSPYNTGFNERWGNSSGKSKQESERHEVLYKGVCGKCGARRIDSQLGLEETPQEYVEKMVRVFREVWRVLKDDGTLWLNMGDGYAASGVSGLSVKGETSTLVGSANSAHTTQKKSVLAGLKPKDLCMMPARVAMALQQPYYSGSIKDERDRIWLAAMLDAEGCMFIHRRKEGQHNGQGYYRTHDNFGPGVEISNTHEAIIQRILSIVGKGSICTQGPEENGRRKQLLYRWNLRTTESKELVRALYPHLIAKRQQARILYGCPSSGDEATRAHASLIAMHRGLPPTIDFKDPPSCFEKGWTIRSDIIWSKLNPMPESVTDRPTKAHEYIFLLTKAERYFYDAEAIREPDSGLQGGRQQAAFNGTNKYSDCDYKSTHVGHGHDGIGRQTYTGFRNKRTVWTIATQPYREAHFATFPEEIPNLCILAGSKVGDVVLDPFAGSGTTGRVALELGRKAVLIELSPQYVTMIRERTNVTIGMF